MPLYPVENDYPDPFNCRRQTGSNTGRADAVSLSTGFEDALADTDAERLMDLYAEAIIDHGIRGRLPTSTLPFLAWATGVNLWE